MKRRAAPKLYEIVRWQVNGILSRFHARHPGDDAAMCGDPVITIGTWFFARPPDDGRPDDPLSVIHDLFATKAPCLGCVDTVSRGDQVTE